AEIQRVIAVQERQHTRQLARETRKLCRAEGIGGPVALLGVGALLAGLVLGLIGATSGFPLDMMGTAVGALIGGVLLVRYPRHRGGWSGQRPAGAQQTRGDQAEGGLSNRRDQMGRRVGAEPAGRLELRGPLATAA